MKRTNICCALLLVVLMCGFCGSVWALEASVDYWYARPSGVDVLIYNIDGGEDIIHSIPAKGTPVSASVKLTQDRRK